MRSKTLGLLSALALGAATLTAAAPASAGLVTLCQGEAGPVTVPSDLRVPADASCELHGTTVKGDVVVSENADLIVEGGTFDGDVDVEAGGYLDTTDTTVAGRVVMNSSYGAFLDSSTFGDIQMTDTNDSGTQSFLYAYQSHVRGQVTSSVGSTVIESTVVDGQVLGRDGVYVDSYDSVVGGQLVSVNNSSGSVVCRSEIYGNARFVNNSFGLQIGSDGPFQSCDGATYWGGNVVISDNDGQIVVSNNIIAGSLSGTGNTPAPTGSHNRVRGAVNGQFIDMQPPSSAVRAHAATEHRTDLRHRASQRRATAVSAAEASPLALS